jgi:hypothetical protein
VGSAALALFALTTLAAVAAVVSAVLCLLLRSEVRRGREDVDRVRRGLSDLVVVGSEVKRGVAKLEGVEGAVQDAHADVKRVQRGVADLTNVCTRTNLYAQKAIAARAKQAGALDDLVAAHAEDPLLHKKSDAG